MITATELSLQPRILVVEDDALVARDVEQSLQAMGYEVVAVATDAPDAIGLAERSRPDLVLMDIRLPGSMDGVEAGARITRDYDVPVVFLTAHSDDATLLRAKEAGSFGYLVKPFDVSGLKAAIEVAVYRHQMESLVRESEDRLQTTLRSMREAVLITDTDASVTFVNPAAEYLLARPSGSVLGRPADEVLVLEGDGGQTLDPVGTALGEGLPAYLSGRVVLRTADGRRVPVGGSVSPLARTTNGSGGTVVVLRDASIERQMQDAVRAREERYRRLFDGSLWGVFELAEDGRVVHANEAMAAMVGYEDVEALIDIPFPSLLPVPIEFEYLIARLRSGDVPPHRRTLRRADGGTTPVVLSLHRESAGEAPYVGRVVDLSEQEVIDEDLERHRRIEATGRLAAGVAHEFNNMLTVIRGHADLLAEGPAGGSEDLEAIGAATDRATTLVQRLLTVGHGRMTDSEALRLGDVLRAWLDTFLAAADPVPVTLDVSVDEWWVTVDRSMLRESLHALVENAGLASAGDGEAVRISVVAPAGDPSRARHGRGPYVGIRVEDRGSGMSPETLQRACEAFFSLWPGRAGLGLAAVQGFAEQNEGWLDLVSTPEVGTAATLYLPVARAPSENG